MIQWPKRLSEKKTAPGTAGRHFRREGIGDWSMAAPRVKPSPAFTH